MTRHRTPPSPKNPSRPPARLHILLARDAPVALILRRGPADWYQLLRWNTRNDEFEPGAWFRGRIYESCCGLSTDGELLVYFVHQGRRLGTDYTDAWTAVSRPPWLKALALWPWGSTWGEGGYFTGPRDLALAGCHAENHHPDHPPEGLNLIEPGAPLPAAPPSVPEAEWSGHDQHGRLIFTHQGQIWAVDPSSGGARRLLDLDRFEPDPQPAPDWAGLSPRTSSRRIRQARRRYLSAYPPLKAN